MRSKLLIILIIIGLIFIVFYSNVQAATFGLQSSKSEVTVGDSFSVTISGIYGKVTISGTNTSVSPSGSQFVDGSLTLTCTTSKEGTAKVTVTAHEAATTGANPQEVSETKSVSVTVKAKPVETPIPTSTQTTTTKKPTTNKTTTTKKETPVVETKEKEEATTLWGINSVKLIGVKENEEKIDIELDKTFDIKVYEYECNVESDIKRIEIQKEAYEYNKYVTITGAEEDLKEGENTITLTLSKEGQNDLVYTIKINKEVAEEVSIEPVAKKKEFVDITMPLWSFIMLEVVVVIITIAITSIVWLIARKKVNK